MELWQLREVLWRWAVEWQLVEVGRGDAAEEGVTIFGEAAGL